jgi:pimeloyl-ACP methyl ester carboxylesterase
MDAEGLETAALAGRSIGARVAGEVAALAPGRVTGLILVGPVGAVPYGFTDKLKWKAMSRKSVLSSVPESSMRNAASYGFEGEGAGKKGFVARALASRTGKDASFVTTAVERMVDGVLTPRRFRELKGTKTPLLVLVGEKDRLPARRRPQASARAPTPISWAARSGTTADRGSRRVAKEISGFMK